MKTGHLPADYALVLQQLNEDGGEDFATLAEMLRFDRSRIAHIVQALHHKGLVVIRGLERGSPWLMLSGKGRRLMTYLWPESARPAMA